MNRLMESIAATVLVAGAPVIAQTSSFQPSFQTSSVSTGCPLSALNFGGGTVMIGDFNGDHNPDVATICQFGSKISVLLGNGDGTFKAPILSPFPDLTVRGAILALDVNGDGRDDLLFTTNGGSYLNGVRDCGSVQSGSSHLLNILVSKGNGTFADPATVPTNGFYNLWGSADLNGDGIPDLLFNDDTQLDVGYMAGTKGGTFSAPVSIPTSADQCSGMGATGDFSNNKHPDIVVSSEPPFSSSSSTLWLVTNNGNLSFAPPVALNTESSGITQTLAADFNGDGKLDIGLSAEKFSVFLGNGTGAFQQAPSSLTTFFPTPWLTADVNADGKADLVQNGIGGVHFYLSNGDGTFQHVLAGTGVADFVADFNRDGKPDFAGISGNNVEVMINTTVLASVSGALNGATFSTSEPLTPGSLATIFGSGFTAAGVAAEAGAIPLPLSLGQVSVTVGGFPAPLLYASAKQINFQVPWEVAGSTADIVVNANGTTLAPFHASVGAVSPGIFTTQYGTGQAIAINADGSLAGPAGSIPGLAVHPASAGDVLLILATGLGAVSPRIPDGANSADARRDTIATPTVLIGGQPSHVLFSGMSPQFVGVNQINVVAPQGVTGVVPLQISLGGITTSSKVTVALQ
ncbi:MAG TPA: FG-GAP-like repeat-containing protein [Bryobacteraceae bacterium]|nr:FG-GAP-like repeat-containing protein [Bryobacteraceae bacterium]